MDPETIVLPESMRDDVLGRAAEAACLGVSESVGNLIRADLERNTADRAENRRRLLA